MFSLQLFTILCASGTLHILFVAQSTLRTEHVNIIPTCVPLCLAFQNVLQLRANVPFGVNNIDDVCSMHDGLTCR